MIVGKLAGVALLAATSFSVGCGGGGGGDSPGVAADPVKNAPEAEVIDEVRPATGASAETDEEPGTAQAPAASESSATPATSTGVTPPADAADADSEEPDMRDIVLADGPALQSDSELGQLAATLRRIGVSVLVDLNTTLASGQALDPTSQRCTGDFQPELGEALLQIDCSRESLRAVSDVQIIHIAMLESDACQAGLLAGEPDTCRLASLRLVMPTRFEFPAVTTETSGVFVPQRPQPIDGADVAFRETGLDQLVIRNDDASVRGEFACDIELTSTVPAVSGDDIVDCEHEISRVNDRLNQLLTAGGF